MRRIGAVLILLAIVASAGCGGSREAEIPENPLPLPTEGPQPALKRPLEAPPTPPAQP